MTAQPADNVTPIRDLSASGNLNQLVKHARAISAQIAALTDELDEVKRRVRAVIPPGSSVDVDGKPVKVIAVQRFNEQQALAVLPEQLVSLCQITKLDGATAKNNLPPALFQQCCVVSGEPSVHGLT